MIDHTPIAQTINEYETEQKLLINELNYAVKQEDMDECDKIERRLHVVDIVLVDLYKKYNIEAEKNLNELRG